MSRRIGLAGAQLGPIGRGETRTSVVRRMIELMRGAKDRGCSFVVFPELALTTFFPRWYMEDWEAVDSFFETEMPGPQTRPLFEAAQDLGIGFYLGYAEKTAEGRRYNTSILVDRQAEIVGKYRKVHLPGHSEYDSRRPWQHLEKRYFEVGELGFPVWRMKRDLGSGVVGMCLCNDRRWPETYRVMGLQGVELVVLGYNTPVGNGVGQEPPHIRMMHNQLSMQAGAYQNATWVCGVAKAGVEEGVPMMGGSVIVSPQGEIVAQTYTEDDELITASCDLDLCQFGKSTIFNFAAHRRPEHYGLITSQAGAVAPPERDD